MHIVIIMNTSRFGVLDVSQNFYYQFCCWPAWQPQNPHLRGQVQFFIFLQNNVEVVRHAPDSIYLMYLESM